MTLVSLACSVLKQTLASSLVQSQLTAYINLNKLHTINLPTVLYSLYYMHFSNPV